MIAGLYLIAGLIATHFTGLIGDDASRTRGGSETASFATVELTNGASIAVHRQPGVPLVSLRMSILAPDPAGYAGAGHMIQHILYPSLQDRVRRIGGTVQLQRTADAIVYTVTGPAVELPALSELLVSTLQPPAAPVDAVLRAERELREERLAEWETAPAHTRALLRAQLFPGDLSAAGTDRSATRFSSSTIPAIWTEMYRPERVSVVAVGDVYLSDVETAFAAIPEAYEVRRLGIEQDTVTLMSLAPAEATRAWYGRGWQTTDLAPAAVTVTTHLLGNAIRDRLPTAQVDAEHWWTHFGQAITLIVAIPARGADDARVELDLAVSSLYARLDDAQVAAAARTIRREMLFFSRTPERMAELIGQFIDREGDPGGTEAFYRELDEMDVDDVRDVLTVIRERNPAVVEIPPQALRPR